MTSETRYTINRRALRLNDRELQGRLINALVIMEVLVAVAAIVYLDIRFADTLESFIYRVHGVSVKAATVALLTELGWTLVGFFLINLCALWIAHLLWKRYCGQVIEAFRSRVAATANLDFRPQPDTGVRHQVIDTVRQWRALERERLMKVRSLTRLLEQQVDEDIPNEHAIRATLDRLQAYLACQPADLAADSPAPREAPRP